MKFYVYRTSHRKETPPCDGAYQELVSFFDYEPDMEWVVEIPNLEALIELVKKGGKEVIIDSNQSWCSLPSIEIYDSYRE